MRYLIEALLVIGALVLGLWLGQMLKPLRRRGGGAARGEPEKQYGEHRVRIHDEETDDDYDFFENESFGDDPKKPGSLGKVHAVGGGIDDVSIWGDGVPGGTVPLDQIECGRSYYVTRERLIDKGNDKTCGGPAQSKSNSTQ